MKNSMVAGRLSHPVLAMALTASMLAPAWSATPLADQPVFSTISVPGNLALALSVEFPTAISVAHTDATYNAASSYLGYFDPNKCYLYHYDATEALRHFYPAGAATNRTCVGADDGKWSGNFMNWATMQTIDPFRWALTGGYRTDRHSHRDHPGEGLGLCQGSISNFPDRTLTNATNIANATPFGWGSLTKKRRMRARQQDALHRHRSDRQRGDGVTTTYRASAGGTVYEVSVRVKVCDTSAGAGPLEPNCTLYPAGNYKPTGLIQQYADQIRYSAFGYLNDSNVSRDGGVLRAQQKFVGPTRPVPGGGPVANTHPVSGVKCRSGVRPTA